METPELDKLREVSEKSQEIGHFLDWLVSKDIVLAQWGEPYDEPISPHRPHADEDGGKRKCVECGREASHYKDDYICYVCRFKQDLKDADYEIDGHKVYEVDGRFYVTRYDRTKLWQLRYQPEKLLAEFYDIDLDKLNEEKTALLERTRNQTRR